MKAAERRMRTMVRRLRGMALAHGLSPSMRCTVLDLYDTVQAAVARGDQPEATTLNCWDLLVQWYGREVAVTGAGQVPVSTLVGREVTATGAGQVPVSTRPALSSLAVRCCCRSSRSGRAGCGT